MKITHDVHNHTFISSCSHDPEATVQAYCRRAAELGHNVLGIANHVWDETVPGADSWYANQPVKYVAAARDSVPADTAGVKVLVGCETEYYAMRDILGMRADTAEKYFDYVLVPHSHVHMKEQGRVCPDPDDVKARRRAMTARIKAALPYLTDKQAAKMANTLSVNELADYIYATPVDLAQFYADQMIASFEGLMNNAEFIAMTKRVPVSIAHSMHACCIPGEQTYAANRTLKEDDILRCYRMAAALGVGIEVNTSCFNPKDDYADEINIRTMKLAKEAGCKFTFGTDTHSLAGLDSIRKGDRISELCGITQDDLMEFCK